MFPNRQWETAALMPVATFTRLTVTEMPAGESPVPRRMLEEVGPKPMPRAPSTNDAANPARKTISSSLIPTKLVGKVEWAPGIRSPGHGVWDDGRMYISAKVDYALRVLLALAAAPAEIPLTGESLATAQGLPVKFVENTLVELRRAGVVASKRGPEGGYRLARPADEIAVADVFRILEGPLADVRGERPEDTVYEGPAEHLQEVWVAVRSALRLVLESVTLADVLSGELPTSVTDLLAAPDAWQRRPRR